jgi:hypothetical protein
VLTTADSEELAKRIRAESLVKIFSLKGEGLDYMMDEVLRCTVDHKLQESLSVEIQKQGKCCLVL